jgi:trimeric autotransporter adhesin
MKRTSWVPVLVLACIWMATAALPAAADDPPVASFYVVCNGHTCFPDAEGSSDDVHITNYSWAWGDGATTSGSNQSAPSHTYAANGTYTITLTVRDGLNQTGVTSHNVTVDLAPNPFFKMICDGRTCSVDGVASTDDLGIASYLWNWGDEDVTVTTGTTSSHEYSWDDTFTIILTVTDSTGNTSSTSRLANTVDNPPTATFYGVCVSNRLCAVDAESSGDDHYLTNYNWNWGDGTTTNGSNSAPSHTYAVAGTYTITLTVTDSIGQTNSDRLTFTATN